MMEKKLEWNFIGTDDQPMVGEKCLICTKEDLPNIREAWFFHVWVFDDLSWVGPDNVLCWASAPSGEPEPEHGVFDDTLQITFRSVEGAVIEGSGWKIIGIDLDSTKTLMVSFRELFWDGKHWRMFETNAITNHPDFYLQTPVCLP